MQCHIQEITTSVASDPTGTYLIGGTKSGRLYWWDICSGDLMASFQGHFKAITVAQFTKCGLYLVTASLDGMVRMWDTIDVVAATTAGLGEETSSRTKNAMFTPYRSWSPHTLSITGLHLQGSGSIGASPLRVMSCSLDRSLVLYDVAAGQQCLRRALPEGAESIVCNTMGDHVCIGSTSGVIYLINVSAAAHAASTVPKTGEASVEVLEGHSRRVSSMSFSIDNCTLVSGSEDGSVRVWDTWTRQCVREFKPMGKCAVTAVLVSLYTRIKLSYI